MDMLTAVEWARFSVFPSFTVIALIALLASFGIPLTNRQKNILLVISFEKPKKSEIEDGFTHFIGKKGALESNELAYHIPGRKIYFSELNRERYILNAAKTKSVCKEYNCTVTELLTARGIQKQGLQDLVRRRRYLLD